MGQLTVNEYECDEAEDDEQGILDASGDKVDIAFQPSHVEDV